MHNYIIVARKQDLADLVNYGEILVPLYSFIPYQGEFEALGGDNEIRKEAFAHVNPFTYTSSYVVLDVQTDEQLTGADEYRLDIQNVRHVAPLDRSGQTDMEISWGEGFKFSEPLWDSGVRDVFVANTARLARLGAHDMWDIFGIQEDIKPLDEKFSDDRIRRFCECVYDSTGHDKLGKWKDKNETEWYLWLYLLRYERHQPWPKDTMGYVYDAVSVAHNWLEGSDLGDGVRNSPIIAFLDQLHSQKPDIYLSQTLMALKQRASDARDDKDSVRGFVHTLGPNGFLGTMVIFLLLKGRYVSNGNNLSKIKGTIQNVLDKAANFENGSGGLITAHSINMALYMLGLTITREGTGTEWYIKKGIGWVVPIPEKKPEPELQPMQTTVPSKANTQAAGKKLAKQTAKGKSGNPAPTGQKTNQSKGKRTTSASKPKPAEQGTLQFAETTAAAPSSEQSKPANTQPAAEQTSTFPEKPAAASTPAPGQQAAQTPNATTPPATPPEGK